MAERDTAVIRFLERAYGLAGFIAAVRQEIIFLPPKGMDR